ncbi:MAG: hypothetical protein ACRD3T_02315, partial [Terriglobia bacterium]
PRCKGGSGDSDVGSTTAVTDRRYSEVDASLPAFTLVSRRVSDGPPRGWRGPRQELLNGNDGAWRCRTIFNCVEACPRGINVTRAIGEAKPALLFRKM